MKLILTILFLSGFFFTKAQRIFIHEDTLSTVRKSILLDAGGTVKRVGVTKRKILLTEFEASSKYFKKSRTQYWIANAAALVGFVGFSYYNNKVTNNGYLLPNEKRKYNTLSAVVSVPLLSFAVIQVFQSRKSMKKAVHFYNSEKKKN